MKNVYTLCSKLTVLLLMSVIVGQLKAQTTTLNTTTVSGFSNNNGSGMVLFNFENTNPYSITITDVEGIVGTAGATTAELWIRTTPLSGATYSGGVSVSTGWTLAASGTFTGIANTTTTNLTTQPLLTGISVTIPANSMYAMCVTAYSGTSGRLRYHTMVSPNIPATTVSGGGCNILMGNGSAGTLNNTSFGAASAPPATTATYNNPRAFTGKITFIGNSGPCTTPPTAGTATSNPSTSICTGTPVALNLTGNSTGTGQTYVWQKSTNLTPPHTWTDVSTSATTTAFSVNPTTTTFYRAAVTCSGSTTYSDSVKVVVNPAFPAGVYTIKGSQATGGSNYQTFADAISALSCGISGPVVFDVEPGTYAEQVVIPAIGGTSSTNTVKFRGNLATIAPPAAQLVTGARHGIWLNGADYVTLDSLIIDVSAGTFGWGVVMTNQADNNKISNCSINVSLTNTTSGNHMGIVINGSATATASSGNNGNNNILTNNTINGGYYGIYLYGNSGAGLQNTNNQVSKNIIKDVYGYSVYMLYQSGAAIDSNDISRPTRTSALSGGSGVYLTTGNINCTVKRNLIHNMFDAATASTSTLYCIYVAADGATGQENKIINNLIYNTGGNGILYGIYNTTGTYMQAYHNTIALNDQVATTGTAYGFYQTGSAAGIDFRNNIVTISRSGTGVKRCVYFVTTTSTIVSNNNVLFMNAASGTDNKVGQFGTTSFTDLAAWQGANTNAYDQQSVSVDPLFINPSGNPADYTPTESTVNNIGTPVGVLQDILNVTRSSVNPDPGAYEFSLISAGVDMKAEALVTPAVQAKGCYGAAEPVTIRIRNNGSSTINFVSTPVTVNVTITGGTPQSFSKVVNTGTLASDATLDVVMTGTADLSGVATYNFDASTTVSGDVNTGNDPMPTAVRTKQALSAGTASATPDTKCASSSTNPTLNSTGTDGYTGLQWQQSTTAGSGYTDIIGGTTLSFTVPSITQTMFYKLKATCSTFTDYSAEIQVTYNNPQLNTTTGGTRCGTGTVDLSATSASSTINWYTAASGGSPIGTGNTFTTPTISSTTTYYAAASDGGSITHFGKLDATSTTGNTGYTDVGLMFDALTPFTLESVAIYPIGTGGTASITIALKNSAGTVLQTTTATVTTAPLPGVKTVVPLNFQVPAGTGLRLVANGATGLTSLIREITTGFTYPYTLPGVASITSAYTGGASSSYYYYFYDWVAVTGCEGSRVAVTATVTTPPTLTATAGKTICNNAAQLLEVTSNLADFNSYVWSPQTDLYTDAAATIPYTGGSATQVYVKGTTAGSTVYTVTSNNSSSQCVNTANSTIIIMPDPTITSGNGSICVSGTASLSLSPASGYGAGTMQWQNSSNGVSYNDISGATSNTYTSPTLTQTTYYKLILKDQAGATCNQPTFTVTVNNPQVISTTPASRCGTGSVVLQASGSAGTLLDWYSTSSGGISLATGNSFATPSISSTTTYYVGASTSGGGGGNASPLMITEMDLGTNDQLEIQNVSPTAIDVTGWKIAISDNYTNINAVNANVQTLSGVMNPGETKSWTDLTTATNYWGSNMLWNPGAYPSFTGWAAILDNNNNLRDIVFLNWPSSNIQGANVTIGSTTITVGSQWSGNGIDISTVAGTQSVSRQGNMDNNTGSDFAIINLSIGSTNTGMTLPFSGFECSSARTAVVATVNTSASNAAGVVGGSSECATATIAGSTEFNYTDCDRIAIVTPSGGSAVSGSVDACVKIDASVQTAPTGEPYVQRHYDITPSTNPNTATSIITLYYLQSEFNAFNAANGTYPDLPTGSGDATGKANLKITQYRGTGTAPGNYTGTVSYIDPSDVNIVWNSTDSRWEVNFSATGGGSFYVHTGNYVLPVTIVDFRGERVGSINKLYWNTTTEVNNGGFELERSADGRSFSKISFINTKADNGNSTATLNYNYNDERPLSGNNYYRLKQIDKDGRFSYSNVVLLRSKVTEITISSVYPNPARDEVNLIITSPLADKIKIVVTDLTGKVIMQQPAQLVIGDNQHQLKVASLASGTYIIKAVCSSGCETAVHRFVKQ